MKNHLLIIPFLALAMTSCGGGSGSDMDSMIDYYPVQEDQGKKWGFVGKDGNMLISEEYKNQPSPVVNGLYFVKNDNGTYTLYEASQKPKEILEDLASVGYMQDGLLPISRKNERISVVNKAGETKFTLEPVGGREIVNCAPYFTEGLLIAVDQENNFGAYDTKGEKAIDFKYAAIGPFNEGVALAMKVTNEESKETKTIVIDKNGNELDDIKIKEGYSPMKESFNDGYLAIRDKEGSFRFINLKGEEIKLPGKVKNIGEWNSKCFVFYGDDGWGVMSLDDKNDIIIKAKYSGIKLLPDNKFFAVDGKDYYILNNAGDKELELSDDYSAFTVINNASFRFIALEKSHYVLLDKEGKPLNKLEFANIVTSLDLDGVVSNFFDVAGMVEALLANVNDKGVGPYYIDEPAKALGFNPEDYRYSSSFTNEDLDSKGYKYEISFVGRTDNSIATYDYDFSKNEYVYMINPEAKVSMLVVSADCNNNYWEEAKDKLYEAIKAKGFKAEVENNNAAVYTKGNVILLVNPGRTITLSMIQNTPESLSQLVRMAKSATGDNVEESYGYSSDEVPVEVEPDYMFDTNYYDENW